MEDQENQEEIIDGAIPLSNEELIEELDTTSLRTYVAYSPNGKIFGTVNLKESDMLLTSELDGRLYLEGTGSWEHDCVINGEVVPKIDVPYVWNSPILSGLPEGTVVEVEGEFYPITEGEIEFDSDTPGPLKVILNGPSIYRETTIIVEII